MVFRDLKKMLSKKMTESSYFAKQPYKIKKELIGAAIVFLVGGVLFGKYVGFFVAVPGYFVFALLLSGFIYLIFALVMSKKTLKGAEAEWHIKGFKEYIETAEKYRVQFQEKENIFEKFLPYAIVFGLTKKWARAFEGIYQHQPNWYISTAPVAHFSTIAFVGSLNKSLNSFNSVVSPQGRSSGSGFSGGFSGGGAGGGGGGSW